MTSEQIKKIVDTIQKLSMPEERVDYTFWNPYIENGVEQYNLYAYGGSLTQLYFNNIYRAGKFTADYCKHFKDTEEGKRIYDSFVHSTSHAKGVETLEGWDENTWDSILYAFDKWSVKSENPEYERRRQTFICHNHENNDDFKIFVMEKNVKIGEKDTPELDICAVRFVNNKPIIAFTEYKCTTSALKGKTTLVKHYNDMIRYYKDSDQIEEFVKLYNLKQELLGKHASLEAGVCGSEIVFLLSHIDWTYREKFEKSGKGGKKSKCIDPTVLLDDLEKLRAEGKNFAEHKDNIKIVILEDEKQIINPSNYITYDKAVAYIRNKIAEVDALA